jgi:hypothetical protein
MSKKKIHIGSIKPSEVKVRKKNPPPTQVQKSPKDYDRKKLKQKTRKELNDE